MAQTSQKTGWWSSLRAVLLDALFPSRCAGCRQVGAVWCSTCQASVTWLHPPLCPKCGRPQSHDRPCSACQRRLLRLDGIRSAALFEGPLRQAIHGFKYNGQAALALPLGRLLEHYWAENPLEVDAIVPVPLHPSRLRERGYNQSALLARHLAAAAHVPVLEDGLVRTRATAAQMTLGAAERRTNVQGAFECVDNRLAGLRIALVDDVCTTGATLEACGAALFQVGATAVWALTLARAV